MSNLFFIGLLVLHIGAIVAWFGASLLYASVLFPSFSKMNQESRADLFLHLAPRFSRYIAASSIVAVLAGTLLFGYMSSYSSGSPVLSGGWSFILIVTGAVLGLVAFIIALGVVVPSSRRLVSVLSESGAESPQLADIAGAISASARAVTVILAFALVLMVVAANL